MANRSILAGLSILLVICTRRTLSDGDITEAAATQYLQAFGYTNNDPRMGNIMSREDLSKGVMMFQRFAGLPQTGELDEATLTKMKQPRCGVPDVVGTEAAARKKRYALQGSKWDKKDLTYKISAYTRDLQNSETDKQIRDAFKMWEKESGLTFRKARSTEKPDIDIRFAPRNHGDGSPFDGRGKTLAHAFFPVYGGDAHFDEDETWSTSPRTGVSLLLVAAHEFGHSLGLSHSDRNSALMAPFYNPSSTGLDTDDIRAIRRLYGNPTSKSRPATRPTRRTTTTRRPRNTRPTKPSRTTTTTTNTPPVGTCNGRFDAITELANGTTYAFKEEQFWRLNNNGMEEGYPQSTRSQWGITGKIDAAITYDGYTDFFQGTMVTRFYNGLKIRGYPRRISAVYRRMPSDIDAAYVWSGNGRIYFVKGDEYWRFNPSTGRGDNGYPKPLTVWKGLPKSLDAALQWNDRTYFFKNGYYWRFDDEEMEVSKSDKAPYPRRTDEWWLGCKDKTLRISGEDVLAGIEEKDSENSSTSLAATSAVLLSLLTFAITVIFT